MQPTGHFDRAAEGDFAIALREVQIAHRKTAAGHINREIHFRAARQVFDVAIAAMFARRHRARAFSRSLVAGFALHAAHMRGRAERWIGEAGHTLRIGGDQRGLALVPGREQFRIGQTADQAGMDQAGKIHAGNMARRGVHALEVPDRLLGLREMIGQEAAAILLGEEAVESPLAILHRANIEQINHQKIARLRPLDADRARQKVDDRQVDVAHVVSAVVVLDEAASPVIGLDDEVVARIDPRDHGNVRMPPIVNHVVVVGRLREVDLDQCIRHSMLPLVYRSHVSEMD